MIATVTAINFNPVGKLRPGEKATVMCLACDRSQAGIVFHYIRAYIEAIPSLAVLVTHVGAESIELRNHVGVIFDEAAFFRDETSASPDL